MKKLDKFFEVYNEEKQKKKKIFNFPYMLCCFFIFFFFFHWNGQIWRKTNISCFCGGNIIYIFGVLEKL